MTDLIGKIHVAVIRMDAKMDAFAAEVKALNDSRLDHETRLRVIEQRPAVSVEEFTKLKEKKFVDSATLWRTVGIMFAAATLAVSIIAVVLR